MEEKRGRTLEQSSFRREGVDLLTERTSRASVSKRDPRERRAEEGPPKQLGRGWDEVES